MTTEASVSIRCIACPLGCSATLTVKDDEVVKVAGTQCRAGKEYVLQEFKDPRRVLTSTVRLQSGEWLPIRSRGTVPKHRIFDVMAALHQVCLEPPVEIGDVVLPNVSGTGVDIVASTACRREQSGRKADGSFV